MTARRLQLRDDVYWVPSVTGAYVLTYRGGVSLTGKSVYRWLDRLAPLLDGQRTSAELTDAMPAERRAMVSTLLAGLQARGVLREIDPQEPVHSSAEAAPVAEVDFIRWFRDDADAAFDRYCDLVTVVIGAGELLPAAIRAAARSGLRNIHALVTSELPTDLTDLTGLTGLQISAAPLGADDLARLLVGTGLVVHVSARVRAGRAARLESICRQHGILLVQAMGLDGEIWSGSHWSHAGHRRAGMSVEPIADGPTVLSATAANMIANHLLHQAFRELTGTVAPAGGSSLTRFEPASGRSQVHRFLPHPFAGAVPAEDERQFSDRMAGLRGGPVLEPGEFSRRVVRACDSRLGVFAEISEGDYAQLPVHVARTTVADPVGLLGPGSARPEVIGFGPDFASARYRTALRALAVYGSLMIDPRRLLDADAHPWPAAGIDPATALAQLQQFPAHGYVRGVALTGPVAPVAPVADVPALVPVIEAFPALVRGRDAYRPPCGVAAAYSWPEAVQVGLLEHCRRLTLAEIGCAEKPFALIDPAGQAGGMAAYALAMLAAVGESVEVYDVTGRLGVPTVACSLGDQVVAYACATTVAGAIDDGLQSTLLTYQARANHQIEYAPPGVPDLPLPLRGRTTSRSGRPARLDTADLDTADLVGRLAGLGLRPVAVPLDHDREVHKIMPYIVHVVVAERQEDSDGGR